ncbi:DUF3108 domain-containing protein [Chitinibacter sp. S2-10]|uniref:DUF3108 domain-containing protein n=1 Tax=Chitinibacter sp. S2-10 TaxID=3373597 RepID=UPI00397779D7
MKQEHTEATPGSQTPSPWHARGFWGLHKYVWWALLLSLVLHLGSLLAEPVYNWLMFSQIDDPVLNKTQRKLASQVLDEHEAPAELANVKPVEKQQVFLQPKDVDLNTSRPKRVRASSVKHAKASAPRAVIASEASQPAAEPSVSSGTMVASAMIASEAASKVAALASASPEASVASRARRVSGEALATKIDRAAAKRFPREIKMEYRYFGIPAYLNWKLSAGRYELQLDVPIPGNARRFISRGQVDKHGVMPEVFIEYRKQFETPKYEVRFDWEKHEVTLAEGAQQKIEPFEAGDQDLLSAALHLALMGGSQPRYEMSMFSGRKRYPEVQFELKGEAQIRVGGKEITALLMSSRAGDRQVDFWLAPDWNNVPVRMVLNLGKDGSYDLSAYNLSLDDKKVLEWVDPNKQGARRP